MHGGFDPPSGEATLVLIVALYVPQAGRGDGNLKEAERGLQGTLDLGYIADEASKEQTGYDSYESGWKVLDRCT